LTTLKQKYICSKTKNVIIAIPAESWTLISKVITWYRGVKDDRRTLSTYSEHVYKFLGRNEHDNVITVRYSDVMQTQVITWNKHYLSYGSKPEFSWTPDIVTERRVCHRLRLVLWVILYRLYLTEVNPRKSHTLQVHIHYKYTYITNTHTLYNHAHQPYPRHIRT